MTFEHKLRSFVDERVDSFGTYQCTRCGEEHVALEVAFRWPDYAVVNDLATEDGPGDELVVDGHAFVRGVVYVPVRGGDRRLGVGIWLAREGTGDHGRIANQINLLGPLLGARAKVLPGEPGLRPAFELIDHPLAQAQREGLDADVVDRWRSDQVHCGEPEPLGEPFTASLGTHGWELLGADALGKEACEEPPVPGDFAKIAVRLVTLGQDGAVRDFVAGWWLLVDHVGHNGTSGTLHSQPAVPTTLSLGTRFWLRRGQILDLQRP